MFCSNEASSNLLNNQHIIKSYSDVLLLQVYLVTSDESVNTSVKSEFEKVFINHLWLGSSIEKLFSDNVIAPETLDSRDDFPEQVQQLLDENADSAPLIPNDVAFALLRIQLSELIKYIIQVEQQR